MQPPTECNIYDLLNGGKQFVVPVYQRTYSWKQKECERLWNDIVEMQQKKRDNHFIGCTVTVAEKAIPSGVSTYLVIDGQQRMITLSLLLLALRDYLRENHYENIDYELLNNDFLVNDRRKGDEYYKIVPIPADQSVFYALIKTDEIKSSFQKSRIWENYQFFKGKISSGTLSPEDIKNAMYKLILVNITLTRGTDNPQLIFESLNSTGVDLTQSDLIRNYVLMGYELKEQDRLYYDYWAKIEELFHYENQEDMDHFFRDYLILVLKEIPNEKAIYETFKRVASESLLSCSMEDICEQLLHYARLYTRMIYSNSQNEKLDVVFNDINKLHMEVSYPFLLKVYDDYDRGIISPETFLEVLRISESYVFRRRICGIPSNSHNKTFAGLYSHIKPDDYLNSVKAFFLLCPDYKEFPDDTTFRTKFAERNIYKLSYNGCNYVLSKIQNYGSKSPVDVAKLTIEHIMPETKNLSPEWKRMLGDNWADVHTRLLHTIGNLTLTAYNSELSDRPFAEKKNMNGGFLQSALRINSYVIRCAEWTEKEILSRAEELAGFAAEKIWRYPMLSEAELLPYRPSKDDEVVYKLESYDWSPSARALFNTIDTMILNLSTDVRRECTKLYIAYKYEKNFVDIIVQKERLRLTVNARISDVDDPKGICSDISGKGHWGNGDVEIVLGNANEIDDAVAIVKQALELQMN